MVYEHGIPQLCLQFMIFPGVNDFLHPLRPRFDISIYNLFLSAKHFYVSKFPHARTRARTYARTNVHFTQILRPLGLNN